MESTFAVCVIPREGVESSVNQRYNDFPLIYPVIPREGVERLLADGCQVAAPPR